MPVVEGYAGSPRFAAPISICEIPDSLHDSREPTIAQLLQEKALYSYSEWPKVLFITPIHKRLPRYFKNVCMLSKPQRDLAIKFQHTKHELEEKMSLNRLYM